MPSTPQNKIPNALFPDVITKTTYFWALKAPFKKRQIIFNLFLTAHIDKEIQMLIISHLFDGQLRQASKWSRCLRSWGLSRRPEINFKGFSNTLATLFNYKSFAWIIFSTLFWNNSLKMKHSWCISLYKCFILQTFFWFYIEYIIYISTRFDEFTSI